MSYQVLARKWRPKSFETLVGQEHVVRALAHALQVGRLHHAYLFTGTRGIGKTTIARILAKSLNCERGVSAKPCGECSACQEIDAGRFVDLLEVDAATNTRVDEMRQLLENAVYAPTRGRYKVYVIDEVHMLSNAAFNAMLKTLEEPPEHVKFILATTDPQKIPVTVLSRCLQFNLKQMPQTAIVDHLARVLGEENINADAAALRMLAKAANGSMRDALSLLDQAIAHGSGVVNENDVRAMLGTVGNDYLFRIVDALIRGSAVDLDQLATEMADRSLSFETALVGFGDLMVRIQLVQLAPAARDESDPDAEGIRRAAASLHPEFVQLAYEIALQGREQLPYAPDHATGFLMTLLRLHAFAVGSSPAAGPEKKSPLIEATGRGDGAARTRETGNARAPVTSASPTIKMPTPVQSAHQRRSPTRLPESDAIVRRPDWSVLLSRMQLTGMVRELAQHCAVLEFSDERILLGLSSVHRHLLTRLAQDRLQLAVSAQVSENQRLSFTFVDEPGQTPAAVADRSRKEARDAAVAAIESDPIVRELIDLLDATVNESTIVGMSKNERA